MSKEELDSQITKRLNILILLMLDNSGGGQKVTMSQKIRQLLDLGLKQLDVADIVGKPPKYVTAIVAQDKKRKSKGKA